MVQNFLNLTKLTFTPMLLAANVSSFRTNQSRAPKCLHQFATKDFFQQKTALFLLEASSYFRDS